MNSINTQAEFEAEFERLCRWRSAWLRLANDRDRMRKMGGLQSQMDYVCERSQRANRQIAKLMREYDARTKNAPLNDQEAQVQSSPPLTGHWHHGNGVLVCGTVRIASADFDTNPSQEFQNEMFKWMCGVLNNAIDAAKAS